MRSRFETEVDCNVRPASHRPRCDHDVTKDVDDPATLFIVYAAVIGLALLTIGLSSLGLGKFALPLNWLSAPCRRGWSRTTSCTCAGRRVVILTALSSIFWMGILFVLFLSDYMTRHRVVG